MSQTTHLSHPATRAYSYAHSPTGSLRQACLASGGAGSVIYPIGNCQVWQPTPLARKQRQADFYVLEASLIGKQHVGLGSLFLGAHGYHPTRGVVLFTSTLVDAQAQALHTV